MFQRLLVANRGEVAVRIARAARELGIAPIGVASEADLGASWTRHFDDVICIGPASATESYLRLERIVQAALQARTSALHPGWGFLAENPRLAALCKAHEIAFVGPRPGVMDLLGNKSRAKQALRAAGLDPVPGSDGPLAGAEEAARAAARVGYPVILKADAGGGGRGMRRCSDERELREGFAAAAAEALAAFGDGSLSLERYVSGGRHVEVQILCDVFGSGVHLGERECSIQRKHQKLIEESPSPVLLPSERAALGEDAVRAALEVGYTSAGTVEFLRSPDGRIYFLEMNTRLQVEHPVSELVSGVDVVKKQLEIAANRPLGLLQRDVRCSGHALECRINAEDPEHDFRPSPGTLAAFEIPREPGPGTVRVDTHLEPGDRITPHYDSLLAKVITHAASRADAIETMIRALRGARIEGVKTTIPLHLAVLASEEFQEGDYDTSTIPGWSSRSAERVRA